jgi:hypothetical protein
MAPRGLTLPTKNTFIEFPVPVGDLLLAPTARCRASSSPPGMRRRLESEPSCLEAMPESDLVDTESGSEVAYSSDVSDSPGFRYEPCEPYEAEPAAPQWQAACEWEQPAPQYVYTVPMFDDDLFPAPAYSGFNLGMASWEQEAF